VNTRVALAAALLAAAPLVARAESPRSGSFELRAGPYRPNIDTDFTTKPGPYETIFGGGRPWMFRLGVAKSLVRFLGPVELGFSAGYFQVNGKGRFLDGTASSDKTGFMVVPTSLTLTWRFEDVVDQLHVPVVPYGRVSFERYNWWVTNGSGSTTKSGATNGWAAGGGLAIHLNTLDPMLGRELDADTGINATYLFAEVMKTSIDDFGSKTSWNLSQDGVAFTFGLLFVF
jgi:hypothetical protein